jgi:signal transduction histidine kinase
VQCLENLIGNAVKYSEAESPIALELKIESQSIDVSIVDSGQGIPEDQKDLIFERFKRADGVVLRKGQTSSGLGLSIVKMLVDAMGGEILLSSEMGVGSTFTIKLPRADV